MVLIITRKVIERKLGNSKYTQIFWHIHLSIRSVIFYLLLLIVWSFIYKYTRTSICEKQYCFRLSAIKWYHLSTYEFMVVVDLFYKWSTCFCCFHFLSTAQADGISQWKLKISLRITELEIQANLLDLEGTSEWKLVNQVI